MAEATATPTPTPSEVTTPAVAATEPAPAPSAIAEAKAPVLPAAEPEPKTNAEVLYPEGAPEGVKAEPDPATPKEPVEGEAKPEAKPEGEAPAPLTVESYAALTVPETITVSEPILGEFKALAVELGVTPEAAQKLVEFYGRAAQDAAAAPLAAWTATQTNWKTTLDAMPEFQGERRAQSLAVLGSAIEEYGDASVREAFDMTGLGNHPGLVKMLYSMALALGEGTPLPQGSPAGQKTKLTPAQILYPDKP